MPEEPRQEILVALAGPEEFEAPHNLTSRRPARLATHGRPVGRQELPGESPPREPSTLCQAPPTLVKRSRKIYIVAFFRTRVLGDYSFSLFERIERNGGCERCPLPAARNGKSARSSPWPGETCWPSRAAVESPGTPVIALAAHTEVRGRTAVRRFESSPSSSPAQVRNRAPGQGTAGQCLRLPALDDPLSGSTEGQVGWTDAS